MHQHRINVLWPAGWRHRDEAIVALTDHSYADIPSGEYHQYLTSQASAMAMAWLVFSGTAMMLVH